MEYRMNQIERISHMDGILTEAEEVIESLLSAMEHYRKIQPALCELTDYYTGPLWKGDCDDDAAGNLPPDLKRGVLSQDGVWNMLEKHHHLRKHLEI